MEAEAKIYLEKTAAGDLIAVFRIPSEINDGYGEDINRVVIGAVAKKRVKIEMHNGLLRDYRVLEPLLKPPAASEGDAEASNA